MQCCPGWRNRRCWGRAVEDDAHDVSLGVYEAAGRREILALSGGGIPAGHDALVGVEVEFIVGRAHREGLDGIPYGAKLPSV